MPLMILYCKHQQELSSDSDPQYIKVFWAENAIGEFPIIMWNNNFTFVAMDDLVVHKLNPGVPCNFFTHTDILNVSSSGRQLTLNLTGGRYLTTYYTLEKFQQWLKSVPFARVHKEHLVNLDHIYSFDHKSEAIILSDKSQIPCVRKFVPQIMNYIFNNDDYMRVNDISDAINPKM